jgi:hypothetical protein
VHADVTADDDDVARTCAFRPDVDAVGDEPDPGGVDEHPVPGSGVHDLGVAGHQSHPGGPRRPSHGLGHPREVRETGALGEDEAGREHERTGAGHREIVDRAVDGQVADGPAGEEQRLHDVRVGGERQPDALHRDDRGVAETGVGGRRAERGQEQVRDQFGRQRAAAAVTHDDRGRVA